MSFPPKAVVEDRSARASPDGVVGGRDGVHPAVPSGEVCRGLVADSVAAFCVFQASPGRLAWATFTVARRARASAGEDHEAEDRALAPLVLTVGDIREAIQPGKAECRSLIRR